MRIEVVGDGGSSSVQARTYAEYRVFAALAQYASRVRDARVVLQRDERNSTRGTAVCAVTVALEPAGSVRTRSRGQHPYEAINRAAERVGDLMRRRTASHLSF